MAARGLQNDQMGWESSQSTGYQVLKITSAKYPSSRSIRKVDNGQKKYHKAEYVQRRVHSSNVQVLFVSEVILIVDVHLNFLGRLSCIKGRLPSKLVFHQRLSSIIFH